MRSLRWSDGGQRDASQSVRSVAGGHTVRPNRALRAPSGPLARSASRRRTVAGAPGPPRSEGRLELRAREDARHARAVSRPRRRRSSPTSASTSRPAQANDEVVREMMARGHARADRRRHDAATPGGGSSSPPTSSASRSTAAAIRTACPRTRSSPRPSASSWAIGVPAVADLRLRALSESARRGELRAAPARGRADRRRRARQPLHRQQRLRSRRPTSRPTSSAKRTRART